MTTNGELNTIPAEIIPTEPKSVAKPIFRRTGLAFDLYVAEFYIKKIKSCMGKHDFTLTLAEFSKLLATKKCAYSGLSMTHSGVGVLASPGKDPNELRFTDLTLERVDRTKGYISGNVKAVSHGFNKIKSVFENPAVDVEFKDLYRFADTLRKLDVK